MDRGGSLRCGSNTEQHQSTEKTIALSQSSDAALPFTYRTTRQTLTRLAIHTAHGGGSAADGAVAKQTKEA